MKRRVKSSNYIRIVKLVIFISFFILLFLSATSCSTKVIQAQKVEYLQHIPVVSSGISANGDSLKLPAFLSPYSKVFLHTLNRECPLNEIPKEWRPSEKLMKDFPIGRSNDSIYFISAIVEMKEGSHLSMLGRAGIFHSDNSYPYSICSIPLYRIDRFISLNGIKRMEILNTPIVPLSKDL